MKELYTFLMFILTGLAIGILFDIFRTSAVPIINITDILLNIPKNILNTSPISSNIFVIFLSAIISDTAPNSLYIIVIIASFIIGIIQIPIIIITPIIPTAFFSTTPEPKTVSTASPNILPNYWYC